MKRIEMTGKRFGRLVVTKFAYTKYTVDYAIKMGRKVNVHIIEDLDVMC